MKKFMNPVLNIHVFDIVTANTESAYGQAKQALSNAGAAYVGEADWNDNETWSIDGPSTAQ